MQALSVCGAHRRKGQWFLRERLLLQRRVREKRVLLPPEHPATKPKHTHRQNTCWTGRNRLWFVAPFELGLGGEQECPARALAEGAQQIGRCRLQPQRLRGRSRRRRNHARRLRIWLRLRLLLFLDFLFLLVALVFVGLSIFLGCLGSLLLLERAQQRQRVRGGGLHLHLLRLRILALKPLHRGLVSVRR